MEVAKNFTLSFKGLEMKNNWTKSFTNQSSRVKLIHPVNLQTRRLGQRSKTDNRFLHAH